MPTREEATLQQEVAAIARIDAVPAILEVVCRTTGMGFAAVARVTESRWIACQVLDRIDFGLLPGGELKVETTICDEIRDSGQPVVIDHVAEDEQYRTHHTPALYGIQSYISMPIFRRSGEFFGTLCAIDPRPARLKTPETISMFRLLADLIAFHLDAQDRAEAHEAALLDERQTAELREQFIAVLGHDLRNPLNAVVAGIRLLNRAPADKLPAVQALIERSTRRMADLIDNILDFARGRLGGGLSLERRAEPQLAADLEQVISELRTAWPRRAIAATIRLDRPVNCDRGRMAQLLSNLIANALSHGAPEETTVVEAVTRGDTFEISVANRGVPIPPEMIERLFQPFFRVTPLPSQQGLGLGLYIVSEIARAHGGSLDVVSTEAETRFTFRMPIA